MMAAVCRAFPGYTLERIAEELDAEQLRLLCEQIEKQPGNYVIMIEPKKS